MKRPVCTSCDHHYFITPSGTPWCDLPWRLSLASGKHLHMDCEHQRSTDGMCKPQAIKFVPIEGQAVMYVDDGKSEVEGAPF